MLLPLPCRTARVQGCEGVSAFRASELPTHAVGTSTLTLFVCTLACQLPRFKNEWAQRYEPSKFRVNVVSGKIPTFIYYDEAGTELERVALDDKTAEELSQVRCCTGVAVWCLSRV